MLARLRREECSRTKHDSVFSKWEILIGPNDWEDHASGKDGVERYRIHNLPSGSSCPGLYELGVTCTPSNEGHRFRRLNPEDIVVVYLGQADNVRTRLQEYGRSGSHLDERNRITFKIGYESASPQGRTALFKDVFSKGYSIVFRWAPVKSKAEAVKTEIHLLNVFDYAWNRRGNGVSRHADILANLKLKPPSPCHSPLRKLLHLKQTAFSKKMGINIDASIPFFEEESASHGLKSLLLPRVLKFSGAQLQFLRDADESFDGEVTCGVAIGHGAICRRKPLPGRKRCAEHKGKRIIGTSSVSSMDSSTHGPKSCELQKERKMFRPILYELHKGQRDAVSMSFAEEMWNPVELSSICGVMDDYGFICNKLPVPGRKRCEVHKGRRIVRTHNSWAEENFPICGVMCDASVCMRPPVPGRKRCELHKGRKVLKTSFTP